MRKNSLHFFISLSNKMNINILPWLEDKQIITNTHIEAINTNNLELFGQIKPYLKKAEPIFPLIEFIISRLETVVTLAITDRVWDAEIMLRPAMESFIKLLFITTAEKEEQENRINEFWNSLAEINQLKQSEQAKKSLKHLGQYEINYLAYIPLVLSEEKENEIRAKWTKAERQKIEQKWSFTEMVNSLAKNYRGQPMEIFVTLLHSYRMSSHVTHGDETGIFIIRERNSREPLERELADFTHYLRILSDVYEFCRLTAIETMFFLNQKRDFFIKNQEKLKVVRQLTEKYHSDLFKDKDYDKYRDPNNNITK